uniref:CSON013720 protein n=1 Tax=Culicoides sonorensis TaxID=179676 RepID=A0A336MBD5_CULSO
MSQPAISSYFANRKRGAGSDFITNKAKVMILERNEDVESILQSPTVRRSTRATQKLTFDTKFEENVHQATTPKNRKRTVSEKTPGNKTPRTRGKKNVAEAGQQKLVDFVIKGLLSPKKMQSPLKTAIESPKLQEKSAFGSKDSNLNAERGMQTPVKQKIPSEPRPSASKKDTIQSLPLDKIKDKLGKSDRLTELKTKLNKIQQGLDRLDRMETERKALSTPKKTVEITNEIANKPKSLKKFDQLEVEVLSPRKEFTSPIKIQHTTPQKNPLMTPTKEYKTPTRRLFSPGKDPLMSPPRAPAHHRFQHLIETGRPTLQLPYKYRYILEVFKAVDTVCAMLHNRNEKITFKKLKPAVQRIMRKNFHESHLAQILHLFPEAFNFHIEKTRNFGSETKQETYQLVIVPNGVKLPSKKDIKEENLVKNADQSAMNPQILIERQEKLRNVLIEMVKDEHEKFLKTLDPPMNIDRKKLTRWHPDFDLEGVPEVKRGDLPQPPQEDRMTSAKDILSTARNLFNCGTDMEKALERLQEKKKKDAEEILATPLTDVPNANKNEPEPPAPSKNTQNLLKGVPASLLEKIRQKQAAKALDQMTRRPSQDKEATNYSRLPELARHIRNVFITERKGVLPFDVVLLKIQNSYRATLNNKEMEEHLRLIGKEIPNFLTFPVIRKQLYVKFAKDSNFQDVLTKLEQLAATKRV